MERNHELLELLNTLINTTENNTVTLNKTTLQSVLTCLQVTQAKVRLLQSLSQLLNDELIDLKNQQPVKCFELFFVQHNPLYDTDDDDAFDQQSVKEQHSDTTLESILDKVESIQEASTSPVQYHHQNDKCQHCNRVGHKENQCFDLHPCQHCGKHNHSSDKCSTLKKPTRLKIHYEWIDPWQWSSTTK
jgi:hypothetical protein